MIIYSKLMCIFKIIFNKKIVTPTFSLYFREYYNPLFTFILKAKTKYEKFYNLLSDVEDESNITPSDEKLSEPIKEQSLIYLVYW
jgi:hypothetical protein